MEVVLSDLHLVSISVSVEREGVVGGVVEEPGSLPSDHSKKRVNKGSHKNVHVHLIRRQVRYGVKLVVRGIYSYGNVFQSLNLLINMQPQGTQYCMRCHTLWQACRSSPLSEVFHKSF